MPEKTAAQRTDRWQFVLLLTIVVFAAPFALLLFLASPAIDDFCKASLSFQMIPQPGVIAVTWLYYTQWSPRWLTTMVQSALMSHINLSSSYGPLLFVGLCINLAALWYYFLGTFRLGKLRSLLAAAVFYCAWIASVGHLEEQVYWLTGAIEYDLSFATLLILITLLIQGRPTNVRYVLIALLSVAIPAQHEIAGTFLCMFLLGGIVWRRLEKLPNRHWFLSATLAFLSLGVLIVSPGSRIRATQQHRQLWDIRHGLKWTAQSFLHDAPNWLVSPAILTGVCCILVLFHDEIRSGRMKWLSSNKLAVAGILGMIGIVAEATLVEIASGSPLETTVIGWLQFVFWLCFVCVIVTGLNEVYSASISIGVRAGVLILFGAALFGSTNFRYAKEDLGGTARAWHAANTARFSQRGGDLVFADALRTPHLFMPQWLDPDSHCWVNQCLANYLRVRSVTALHSDEGCLK
jgi:hypothetical protein